MGMRFHSEKFFRRLRAIPSAIKTEMRDALEKGAEETVDVARRYAPVDSGALRNSIDYTFGSHTPDNANVRGAGSGGSGHELSVTIHAGDAKAWYASLVEFGTRPHTIVVKRAEVLRNGAAVFGREAQHGGASARPFFYPAVRLTKKRHIARMRRAMRNAIKKAR